MAESYPPREQFRLGLQIIYDSMIRSRERCIAAINLLNNTINYELKDIDLAGAYLRDLYDGFHYLKHEARCASMEEYKAMRYEIAKVNFTIKEKHNSLNGLNKVLRENKMALDKVEAELRIFIKSERRGVVIYYEDIINRKK